MLSDEERIAFNYYKDCNEKDLENYEHLGDVSKKQAKYLEILLNLIEKQKNIIVSIKRILEDEELDYCDTLDEIYHFYEEVVNNE